MILRMSVLPNERLWRQQRKEVDVQEDTRLLIEQSHVDWVSCNRINVVCQWEEKAGERDPSEDWRSDNLRFPKMFTKITRLLRIACLVVGKKFLLQVLLWVRRVPRRWCKISKCNFCKLLLGWTMIHIGQGGPKINNLYTITPLTFPIVAYHSLCYRIVL